MIRKDLDPFDSDDKFARSGRAAEEQMAFYLKRFFERRSDIHVLNGVRLERDGDAAQIDHLIIHPFGVAVVESKSVMGRIQIKDDGQWIRWYGDKQSKGMQSPITQSKLQAQFLRLELGRAAGAESKFDPVPFDVFVAISDTGVILWPKTGSLAEVLKADQIAERLEASIAKHAAARTGSPWFPAEAMEKLVRFLVAAHKPLNTLGAVAAPLAPAPLEPLPATSTAVSAKWTCKHCRSEHLEVRYAHNYFFHCLQCHENTPLKPGTCPVCGESERIRKKGGDFFFDCRKCDTSRLFFSNSVIAP